MAKTTTTRISLTFDVDVAALDTFRKFWDDENADSADMLVEITREALVTAFSRAGIEAPARAFEIIR